MGEEQEEEEMEAQYPRQQVPGIVLGGRHHGGGGGWKSTANAKSLRKQIKKKDFCSQRSPPFQSQSVSSRSLRFWRDLGNNALEAPL